MDNLTRLAAEALAECFTNIIESCQDFAAFERAAMEVGFESMASAMQVALERYDDQLYKARPSGSTVHGRKSRTLLTECG
ncbi:MAG: hypothetical protein IJ113_03660 [Eggerthellaceae bacterium]|nr:hypothetical protein [Eggerthellaceae bacterium]